MSKVSEAFEVLKEAMTNDPELAWTWHCNIAMMCFDAIKSHEVTVFDSYSAEMSDDDAHQVGNDAASRFMKLCFDADNYKP